jgi:hypothetical protein
MDFLLAWLVPGRNKIDGGPARLTLARAVATVDQGAAAIS